MPIGCSFRGLDAYMIFLESAAKGIEKMGECSMGECSIDRLSRVNRNHAMPGGILTITDQTAPNIIGATDVESQLQDEPDSFTLSVEVCYDYGDGDLLKRV